MSTAPIRPADWLHPVQDPIAAVTWSSDHLQVAYMTTEGVGGILNAATGSSQTGLKGHAGGAFQIAWHPTEPCIASSGQDGGVRFWDPATGQETANIEGGAAWVDHLKWSPNGAWLAAGAGRRLSLYHQERKIVVHTLSDHRSTLTALEWRRDNRAIAVSCYGTVQLYLPESAKVAETLPWKTSLISLAISPDNRWVVAGTQEKSIQIWELPYRPGEELAMSGYEAKVRELSWHPSGRYLATGGGRQIMVWDCGKDGPAGTSPTILDAHSEPVSVLKYQTHGHLLASGSQDGRILFWNVRKSSNPLKEVAIESPITALEWSRDDKRVFFGCRNGTLGMIQAPSN